MNDPNSGAVRAFARTRELFEILGDPLGVQLCELAEARAAREQDQEPAVVLETLMAPLERIASSGSTGGLDVICVELLLAARSLDDPDLETDVRGLLARLGSGELSGSVLQGLWEHVQDLRDAGNPHEGIQGARVALETAVAVGDYVAAATSLILMAGCHDLSDRSDAATLCIRQAGVYLDEGGEHAAAGEVLVEAADRLESEKLVDEANVVLERASEAWDRAGSMVGRLLCMVESARMKMIAGKHQGAIRVLQKAIALSRETGVLEMEVRAWKLQGLAYQTLGEEEQCASCESRVRLLESVIEDS